MFVIMIMKPEKKTSIENFLEIWFFMEKVLCLREKNP